VAVVGGGLAGLSAGCALADAGFEVTLFERKPYLGGRASSYEHSSTGEVMDNCQHVLLGCCTNLLEFYRRIGAEQLVRWYDRLNFIEPGGARSVIAPCWLPAPLHTLPSFLRSSYLGWRDKLAISRALLALIRGLPEDDGRSFLDWLRAHGQTQRAIERFWKLVLVSALNEELDRMSVSMAALVIRDSFLKSARGGQMGIPSVPLTELYSKAGDYIVAKGGRIELRASVEDLQPIAASSGPEQGIWASRSGVRLCVNGAPRMFDYAVMAVPFASLSRLLSQLPEAKPLRTQLARFETSPITGVHLWFDRQITELDHAVLLDRTIQWMFHKSKILQRCATGDGERETGNDYLEVVISASHLLVDKSRQEVIQLAVSELAEFFPVVREAQLVKATVVKEIHATYAPLPGSESYRPGPQSPWPTMFLAGDWTATCWPSTMEGAVRSGYTAAQTLCNAIGHPQQFLVPDLPASGLMRLFA
jgi:zeta-carotene desaturase